MSTLIPQQILSPINRLEECAQFVIEDAREKFTFFGIASPGQEYTISLWIRSVLSGSMIIFGETVPTDTVWKRYEATFTAETSNLEFGFGSAGTYYLYRPQLEIGCMATDWGVSPEDVDDAIEDLTGGLEANKQAVNDTSDRLTLAETKIQQLADSISMLVRNGESGSMVRQDANGLWYFDISGLNTTLTDTVDGLNSLEGIVLDANGHINVLESTAEALQKRTEYVRSYTDENDRPCLELGEGDSTFKVYITNTEIRFADGSVVPAYVSNQKLMIEKAEVKNELQFGKFVWKARDNGNMGLTWIGGS